MIEVLILAVLVGAAYVMAKYDKFQTVSIDSEDVEVNEGVQWEGYMTVALFGGDSREGQLEAGTHADTIIIASIDHDSKEIRLASIYRDTLLEMKDGSYHKANQSYFRGGPKEAINMLNKNLDLDIEDYATVDFKAMVDVVDLMGGIEIEVTEEEADMLNDYLGETAEAAGKKAERLPGGGMYNLDGPQAVTYARLRKLEGGDYKRTERQRLVLQKLFEKAKETDISTLNEIVDTVFPQVSTSFTLREIISLATDGLKYQLGDSQGFPFEKTDGTYKQAGSVVIPIGHAENVQELHEFLYPARDAGEVSEAVKKISDNITYLTGVVRPADYAEDQEGSEEDSEQGNSDWGDNSGEDTLDFEETP